MSRNYFAPEVVQTSAMDCGPAALKCVLDGHGLPVSYGRLREACQTSVDGTSIDTLEDVAAVLGLEAEQIVVPIDHVLLDEADALPAIVVVRLPNGLTHFVVLWRRLGPFVQVMDPAVGRRWMRADAFLREVYEHEMPIPAEQFRDWAGSDDFVDPVRARLRAIGIDRPAAEALAELATADSRWRGLAALDAATRTVTDLVAAGAVASGNEARRLIETLCADEDGRASIPRSDWTAHRDDGDVEAEEVTLRGAVLVRIAGVNADATDDASLQDLPADLCAARTETERPPLRALWEALRSDGLLVPSVWGAAIAIAAAGVTAEALLFRGLLDLRLVLTPGLPRLLAAMALIGFLLALVILERPLESGVLRMGRHLETRLRLAFLHKIPKLGDRYFRSRLGSDMAERCHALAGVRTLPQLVADGLRASFGLLFTAVGIAWLVPSVAWLAFAGAAVALVVPLSMQRLLTERDLRLRTHAGALSQFYLDALLGLVPIRAHGAQSSVAREHESLLAEWVRTGLSLQRRAVAVQGILAVAGLAVAATLVITALEAGGEAGHVLLLVFWALRMPGQGMELATVAQQYPAIRNTVLRVCEPLGALEEPVASPSRMEASPPGGAVLDFEAVDVRAGGHGILEGIDLHVDSGEHVAVVGTSGSGKSSLVGVLLGWHRPAAGEVRVDGQPLDAGRLTALRQQTAWIDPDIALWNRSLDANVRYGSLDEGGVARALELAELRPVVERLPDGMQTSLGEGGKLVSGGEGQRVRTARAVLRSDARLVILDEAFRGLDRTQRRRLTSAARGHWRDATMLYVTHDVADTTDFDRIVVIEDGKLVEDETPSTLLGRPGSRYRALVEREREARASVWTAANWTRTRVEGGQIHVVTEEVPR